MRRGLLQRSPTHFKPTPQKIRVQQMVRMSKTPGDECWLCLRTMPKKVLEGVASSKTLKSRMRWESMVKRKDFRDIPTKMNTDKNEDQRDTVDSARLNAFPVELHL